MSNDTAVFENWDRLFLKRILGVPGFAYPPGSNVRWIDNHAYRLSGGWVHAKEVRFVRPSPPAPLALASHLTAGGSRIPASCWLSWAWGGLWSRGTRRDAR